MLRLLHMSDVRLGAAHPELGSAGARQRERQWDAFERALAFAVSEHAALVIVAGDLFDTNAQPRRAVERAARALGRAVSAGLTVALLPGDLDADGPASAYRTWDLAALGGVAGADRVHVLDPHRPTLVLPALDVAIRAYAADETTTIDETLVAPRDEDEPGVRVKLGVAHLPQGAEPPSDAALAASGLHYLALGGSMTLRTAGGGPGSYGDPGPLESVGPAGDVGRALLVTIDEAARDRVRIEARIVGRTRRLRLELPASDFADEAALAEHLAALADPDLACDVRLTGLRGPELRIDEAALEARLGPGFFHLRIVDAATASPPPPPEPVPESIAGAFVRDVGTRMAAAVAEGRTSDARELGEQLEWGTRLLAASTGMPV